MDFVCLHSLFDRLSTVLISCRGYLDTWILAMITVRERRHFLCPQCHGTSAIHFEVSHFRIAALAGPRGRPSSAQAFRENWPRVGGEWRCVWHIHTFIDWPGHREPFYAVAGCEGDIRVPSKYLVVFRERGRYSLTLRPYWNMTSTGEIGNQPRCCDLMEHWLFMVCFTEEAGTSKPALLIASNNSVKGLSKQ